MIFLDTHAAVLLFESGKRLPAGARRLLENEPAVILEFLSRDFEVATEAEGWLRGAEIAQVLNWTRDASLQQHYPLAFWDQPPGGP